MTVPEVAAVVSISGVSEVTETVCDFGADGHLNIELLHVGCLQRNAGALLRANPGDSTVK